MEQVSQVQYFSKDICTPLSKENAYMYYIANAIDREAFNAFARRVDFKNVKENDIVNSLKNKIISISGVSTLAKYWKIIDDIKELYPNSLIRKLPNYLPKYKYTTYDMCGTNFSKVDRILVWEMAHISPVLTGYYFENMLAKVLGLNDVPSISETLKSKNAVITQQELIDALKRNNVKEGSILYAAVVSYLKQNDYTESISDAVCDLQNYITKNKNALDEYEKNLTNTYIVTTMKNEMKLQHSKFIEDKDMNIRGEIDFVSNSYITDCKCYSQDDFKLWCAQLYLYRKLLKNTTLKLRIINFNTNSVHEFTIMKEGESDSAEENDSDSEYSNDVDDYDL